MNTKDIIEVMAAHRDGFVVEKLVDGWWKADDNPSWAWDREIWRIKREPRDFYIWTNPVTGQREWSETYIPTSSNDLTRVREVLE